MPIKFKVKEKVLKETVNITIDIFSAAGVKSSADANRYKRVVSKGNAIERGTIRTLMGLREEASGTGTDAEIANIQLARQQEIEMSAPDADLKSIVPRVLVASGLDVHLMASPPRKRMRGECVSKTKQYASRSKIPSVTPFGLTAAQVKARTGFRDIVMLLRFLLIVCDGDIELLVSRETTLTWFEEWFLYLEFVWGKTVTTVDAAASAFNMRKTSTVKNILDVKLKKLCEARRRWPKYVTLAEDEFLRAAKWNIQYKGKRVIFWDNTGLPLHKPSEALMQRLTWSAYYAMNVAKGGIFVQLCGWMGVHELYPGAISDSDFLNKTGILEEQEKFQQADGGIPCTNVLDRGYRATRAAWRTGKPFVLQPTFSQGDRHFVTCEVLGSASVASDRSGNERSVRRSKMSSYVKRGTTQHKDIVRLCDVWLAWSWQTNFMYAPVF
jgi:hypothetical protein